MFLVIIFFLFARSFLTSRMIWHIALANLTPLLFDSPNVVLTEANYFLIVLFSFGGIKEHLRKNVFCEYHSSIFLFSMENISQPIFVVCCYCITPTLSHINPLLIVLCTKFQRYPWRLSLQKTANLRLFKNTNLHFDK